ncbi:hypothetical protein AVEN_137386-1 [Araneus ventricosus]|uniref:Uncharacterized protein n=1 Tax=Araneus ventricosus TaxID=182803 RepID=A0A4Y2E184_ARAVE|nr:hypothetical protein AVEN_137386-1 [Araneus ventricosus]
MRKDIELNNLLQYYHYVEFHYIAVKLPEIAYITYSGPVKPDSFKAPAIAGIYGSFGDRYPLYVCCDIEEKFSWTKDPIDADAHTAYPLSKKEYPAKRKPPSFV